MKTSSRLTMITIIFVISVGLLLAVIIDDIVNNINVVGLFNLIPILIFGLVGFIMLRNKYKRID